MSRSGLTRWLALILFIVPGTVHGTGRRPLDAETADLLPSGAVELELALEMAGGAERVLFPGFKGDALVLPVVGLRTGLGSWGEVRVEGDVHSWFDPDEDERASGPGDWRVNTKVRLGPEGRRIRWAALLGVKIPVASDNEGLGTNLADVEARALMGIGMRHGQFDLNLGVAVLGATFRERAQVDVATYAVAYHHRLGERLELDGEIAGREGGDFFPARSMARFGARMEMSGWRLDGAIGAGLTDASPSWELRLGATLGFGRGGADR